MKYCREEVVEIPVQFLEWESVRVDERIFKSIQRAGVITPLIVRRHSAGYQVVLGRARLQAARDIGLESVPAIIRNLNDDELQLFRMEEAVSQKGFQDRRFSEQVAMVNNYYRLVKAQGIRIDRIQAVRGLTEGMHYGSASGRYDSSMYVRDIFGISKRTLSRYARLGNACQSVLKGVDSGVLSRRAAVELSYLSEERQEAVMKLVHEKHYVVTLEHASLLRCLEETGIFWEDAVVGILGRQKQRKKVIRVDGLLKKYGLSEMSENEVYMLVEQAMKSCAGEG